MTKPVRDPNQNQNKHRPPRNPDHAARFPRGPGGGWVSKLTPALEKKILSNISSGLFEKQVAEKSGIAWATLRLWLKKGEAEGAVEPYASFSFKYRRAVISKVEEKHLKIISEVAEGEVIKKNRRPKNAEASMRFLSKRFPQRWNPQDNTPPKDAYEPDTNPSGGNRALDALKRPTPDFLALIKKAGMKLVPLTDEEKAEDIMALLVKQEEDDKQT